MKLALLYIGMVLGGYALHYGDLRPALFGCALFAQATGLLLVSVRPRPDQPKIAAGMVFGMGFYAAMWLTPLSYSAVPLSPLVLATLGAMFAYRFFAPKKAFT